MDLPRRSNASLKHLALSPLSTEPTISPPTSRTPSHTYLASASPQYPSTPTLLSRSNSRTRVRPARSVPQPISTTRSSPALPRQYSTASHSQTNESVIDTPKRRSGMEVDSESSWLLRTASTLQMQSMAEKGTGWLATRDISTNLATPGTADLADDEASPYLPRDEGWTTPRSTMHSRAQSRYISRVPSRLGSRVQSRAGSGVDLRQDGLGALTSLNRVVEGSREVEGPDFVDPAVFEENSDEEEEHIDEGEMKRVVMGRAKGWVDWAVGWMDFRGEDVEESDDEEGEEEDEGDADGKVEGLKERRRRRKLVVNDTDVAGHAVAGPAPDEQHGGVLADTKWLLGVASKVIV